jgi:hypothetical protein
VAPGEGADASFDEARELSRTLNAEAFVVENGDTAGSTGYARFRHGELVEVYGSGEVSSALRRLAGDDADPFFSSRLREASEAGFARRPDSRFVDLTLREAGEFAPPPIWYSVATAEELAEAASPYEVSVARVG